MSNDRNISEMSRGQARTLIGSFAKEYMLYAGLESLDGAELQTRLEEWVMAHLATLQAELEGAQRIGGNAVSQVAYMVDEIKKAFEQTGDWTPSDVVDSCRQAATMLKERDTLTQQLAAREGLIRSIDPVQYFEMADYPLQCQVCHAEAKDGADPFPHKDDCKWQAVAKPSA